MERELQHDNLAEVPPDDTPRVATTVTSHTDTRRLLVGLLISAIAAAVWCIYVVANGTSEFGDSQSYLNYADALRSGRIPASERTPGYPIFILLCRVLASMAHIERARMIGLVQVALLAAVSTYFVYDLTYRLAGRVPIAAGAALLFAGDADVQAFAAAILSEPTIEVGGVEEPGRKYYGRMPGALDPVVARSEHELAILELRTAPAPAAVRLSPDLPRHDLPAEHEGCLSRKLAKKYAGSAGGRTSGLALGPSHSGRFAGPLAHSGVRAAWSTMRIEKPRCTASSTAPWIELQSKVPLCGSIRSQSAVMRIYLRPACWPKSQAPAGVAPAS